MALIECPECKKQISDQAPACIHCGHPMQPVQPSQPIVKDNSNLKRFSGYLVDNKNDYKYVTFFGDDLESAKIDLLKRNPGHTISEKHEIKEAPTAAGKYSCPSCKAKFTNCQKKIGCAVLIIIFVSLGLGLIMIPFLPYHCECQVCGHRWKS